MYLRHQIVPSQVTTTLDKTPVACEQLYTGWGVLTCHIQRTWTMAWCGRFKNTCSCREAAQWSAGIFLASIPQTSCKLLPLATRRPAELLPAACPYTQHGVPSHFHTCSPRLAVGTIAGLVLPSQGLVSQVAESKACLQAQHLLRSPRGLPWWTSAGPWPQLAGCGPSTIRVNSEASC